MHIEDLKTLYDYENWANSKLFSVLLHLAPEEFVQAIGGQYDSVRDVLVHMVNAEWIWLTRCGGKERGHALDPKDFPTAESVKELFSRLEVYLHEFLSGLTDADLARIIDCVNAKGEARPMPLGELMQHAALHGAHHRGQLSLMLQLLEHDPGNFDLLLFYAERRGIAAW